MKFSIIDLQLFVAVAAFGNITHASKSLYMVAAAGSMRIQKLEKNLSARLLVRKNKGIALTPAGEIFLSHAKKILSNIDSLTKNISQYSDGDTGIIKIMAVSIAAEDYLPKYLGEFLISHPEVSVEVESAFSEDIIIALREGVCDIGIIGTSLTLKDLEVFPFFSDSLVVLCHGTHAIAGQKSISFEEVLDYDYIGVNQSHSMHYLLLKYSKEIGKSFKIRASVGSWGQVGYIINQGVGLSVMELSAAKRLAINHDLSIIYLSDSWANRDYHVCVANLTGLPYFTRDLVYRLNKIVAY